MVLSALERLADDVVTVIAMSTLNTNVTYSAFCEAQLSVLCRGGEMKVHSQLYIKCYVRQLATLGIQQTEQHLSMLARRSVAHSSCRLPKSAQLSF